LYIGGKCINYLHNTGVCFCPIGFSGLQCQIGTDGQNNSTTNKALTIKSSIKGVCDIIKCNNGNFIYSLNGEI
jgi:hypothetical protein